MPWNKLEFLGIPRTLGIHFARGACHSIKVVLIWCRQVQLGLVGWGLGFGYQKLYKETLKLNLGKLAFHRAV